MKGDVFMSKLEYILGLILSVVMGVTATLLCLTKESNSIVIGIYLVTMVVLFVFPIIMKKKRRKLLKKLIEAIENEFEAIKELTFKPDLKTNDPEELSIIKKQLETDITLQEKICRFAVSLLRIKDNSKVWLYRLEKNIEDETDYIFLLDRLFFEAERVDKNYMYTEFVPTISKFLSALFEFVDENKNKNKKFKVG